MSAKGHGEGDTMGLLLAELAVTALFVGLGVLFSKGKGACIIAGYNTMSKEKKARYDKNALCRFMGKIMYCLAFAMLLWLASIILQNSVLLSASLYFLVGSIAFAVIYAGTGRRFKK